MSTRRRYRVARKLQSKRRFALNLLVYLGFAASLVVMMLGIGMFGYRYIVGMNWLDSFLHASLVLAGEGSVDLITEDEAKLFVGFYALFSGLVFIGTTAFLIAPLLQRLMHTLDLDDLIIEDQENSETGKEQ